jgi:hypothetical protein
MVQQAEGNMAHASYSRLLATAPASAQQCAIGRVTEEQYKNPCVRKIVDDAAAAAAGLPGMQT